MQYQKLKKEVLKRLEKGLSPTLLYHSYRHVMDVYKSAIRIARSENVGIRDQTILYSAIFLHDAGFLNNSHKDHEEASCQLARELLPEYGYAKKDIEHICELIMATKIPQSPKDKLAEIICDADLDYLGRDDFDEHSTNLFKELREYNLVDDIKVWNRIQVDFLSSHSYFTKTSKDTRESKKAERLEELKEIVDRYS